MGEFRSQFRSQIKGTGSYLPERLLTNQDLERMIETTNEWIVDRTGISTRHIADKNQATSDLAYEASIRALSAAGIGAKELDAILVATVTPDQPMPSTSCMLQAKLGCPSIMALDMSAACTGFLYALSIADQYISSGMYKNILVVGAETLSRIMNYQDRQTCILFGDGAGAVVLSRAPDASKSEILSTHLNSDGSLGELLTLPGGGSRIPPTAQSVADNQHFVQMKGREIFKSAVRVLCDRSRDALNANQMTVADVDWCIVHQANMRIIEAVSEMVQIPMVKQLINVQHVGNTSSASIPIVLDEAVRAGKIQRDQTVLMAAFGAGLTSGSALLRF